MPQHGTLLNCDEAMRLIEQVDDPVTKNLLNMAFVKFVKTTHLEKRLLPERDVDMVYVVTVLREYFSEHQVLCQTLAGDKVGAWFEGE